MRSQAACAAVAAMLIAAPAASQVLTEPNVSLAMAKEIAEAAITACKAEGADVSVAVVDRSGAVRLLYRANSASPHNAELARRKAYTARTYRNPSSAFRDWSLPGQPLAAQRDLAEVIALGGGVPIMVGKEAIGGVGVSGTPSQEADEKCALAAVAAVSGQLR